MIEEESAQPIRRTRWIYAATAYLCIGLAALGLLLPGLPTVPFLLLAAWAASRGSPRVHDWLHEHRHFGPLLRDWMERQAVPVKAKWAAVLLLALSWGLLVWRVEGLMIPLAAGLLFLAVGAFVVSRPSAVTD